MSKTFDQGRDEVAKLCRYFTTNRQAFLAPGVKEAHVRQSLIDPLFESLGWDVGNAAKRAPQYLEVIPEDSLDVEGHQKAPDYTFRVGPLAKFYAEAKKCGANIGADPAPAYQLRRYGWSARVALSVLTDFEELGVYDCALRPRPSDKASHARIQYFRFDEYPDRWRELWDVFSREAVWSGAFDQYAASKRKRGTSEVDVEFLKEIEGWRLALARNIALRNKDLSLDDLNAAVQLTIDRVVFLRMAEDRGLEPYEALLKLSERPDIYSRFMSDLCRRADQKYNSGLFHFQKESGVSEEPDRITPKLAVDDKVFKPILESLYFAHGSPYHFGVLPVEVLGTVYERFLGKVIRLTAGHQAKPEEKPEVRKAGGVYYTPAYIVGYIVQHTVGQQIEGRSPAQLAGGKDKPPFRVLDMACGSGSFLLGAYQCLLDHCLKWYADHKPETYKKAVYKDPRNGQWRLKIEEKKRILTTHIFGVDIDAQAVEVSKLSLLLKVLEGETDQSLSLSLLSYGDRALPNLADNVKCGNSLIGPDYFSGKLIADPEEMKRVNAFDWSQGFPDAIKAGGFDCIIGNPPYGASLYPSMKTHLGERHPFVSDFESSQYFIAKAGTLAKPNGYVSLIVPNTLFLNLYAHKFRSFVASSFSIERLADLAEVDVFAGATVRTAICFLLKGKGTATVEFVAFQSPAILRTVQVIDQGKLVEDDSAWIAGFRGFGVDSLRAKILAVSVPLGELLEVSQGLIPYDKYRGHDEQTIKNRIWHADYKKNNTYKRELRGGDVRRYSVSWNGKQWISYGPWLAAPRKPKYFTQSRLLFREITDPKSGLMHVGYTKEEFYNNPGIINCISHDKAYSLLYVLGLVNSRLLAYLHYSSSPKARKGVFPKILVNDVRNQRIRAINFSDATDVTRHDRMVSLVESMLTLHKQLAAAKADAQKAILQRQIEATDAEIDRLVYDLYGLTAEEIALVEGKDLMRGPAPEGSFRALGTP